MFSMQGQVVECFPVVRVTIRWTWLPPRAITNFISLNFSSRHLIWPANISTHPPHSPFHNYARYVVIKNKQEYWNCNSLPRLEGYITLGWGFEGLVGGGGRGVKTIWKCVLELYCRLDRKQNKKTLRAQCSSSLLTQKILFCGCSGEDFVGMGMGGSAGFLGVRGQITWVKTWSGSDGCFWLTVSCQKVLQIHVKLEIHCETVNIVNFAIFLCVGRNGHCTRL